MSAGKEGGEMEASKGQEAASADENQREALLQGEEGSSEAVRRYLKLAQERREGPTMWIEPAPERGHDTLWRGLARDGEVRFLVARLSDTARQAAILQGCSAASGRLLAEAIVATQLVRSTLNPDAQMQLQIEHDGLAGEIVVDAYPLGEMRALIAQPQATPGDQGMLGLGTASMVRHSANAGTYRSTVSLAGDGLEGLMMRYMVESEQMLCLLRLEVKMRGDEVADAVGFMLQITPEGRREDLAMLVDNLDGLPPLLEGMTEKDPDARAWSERLIKGLRWDQCARQEVGFGCPCSEERVFTMLSTLARPELEEIIEEGAPVRTTCEYCKTEYVIASSRLKNLIAEPS